MVWIDNWETFYAEAEKLYIEHPDHVRTHCAPSRNHTYTCLCALTLHASLSAQTRYVMKYRHVDGKLEIKVTNDRVVRTHRTRCRPSLPRH